MRLPWRHMAKECRHSGRFGRILLSGALLSGWLALATIGVAPVAAQDPPPTPTPTHSVTVCATGCDYATLAAALSAGADELLLSDPLYEAAGLIIDRRVVIHGPSAGGTALQAGDRAAVASDRLFWVRSGGQLILHGLTLQHGRVTAGEGGGLVLNEGRLAAHDCELRDGLAWMGGALLNRGEALLTRCWLDDNAADGAAGAELAGSGGGVLSVDGSSLSMRDCTLSNNRAQLSGGGIHLARAAKAWLSNVTLTDNEARARGGGLVVYGEAHLDHCTVARNRVAAAGGAYVAGLLKTGAGLFAENQGGDLVMAPRSGADEELDLLLDGPNLVADGRVAGALYGAAHLGEFGDMGGQVPVVALLPGSAAIDRVPHDNTAPQTDARGQPRFAPYLSLAGKRGPGDLGAFELQPEHAGAWQGLKRSLQHVWIRLVGR